jgi:hypothetical protein
MGNLQDTVALQRNDSRTQAAYWSGIATSGDDADEIASES